MSLTKDILCRKGSVWKQLLIFFSISSFLFLPRQDKQLLIASDLITWAVTSSGGRYDARTRVVIRHVTKQLRVKFEDVEDAEEVLIEMLNKSSEKEKA